MYICVCAYVCMYHHMEERETETRTEGDAHNIQLPNAHDLLFGAAAVPTDYEGEYFGHGVQVMVPIRGLKGKRPDAGGRRNLKIIRL